MLAYDIISPLFLYMIINLEDAGIQNTFLCKAKALGVYRKCTHQSEEEKHVIFLCLISNSILLVADIIDLCIVSLCLLQQHSQKTALNILKIQR